MSQEKFQNMIMQNFGGLKRYILGFVQVENNIINDNTPSLWLDFVLSLVYNSSVSVVSLFISFSDNDFLKLTKTFSVALLDCEFKVVNDVLSCPTTRFISLTSKFKQEETCTAKAPILSSIGDDEIHH